MTVVMVAVVIMVEMVSDGGDGGSVEDGGCDGGAGSGVGIMEVVAMGRMSGGSSGGTWIVVVMVVGVKVMEAMKLVEMGVAMATTSTGGSGGRDRGNDDAMVADNNIHGWHLMSVESNGNTDMVATALGMKKIEVLKSN